MRIRNLFKQTPVIEKPKLNPAVVTYTCCLCADENCTFYIENLINSSDMFRGYKIAHQRLCFSVKVCNGYSGPIRGKYAELQKLCNAKGTIWLISLRAKELLTLENSAIDALEAAEKEIAGWTAVEQERAQYILEQRQFLTYAQLLLKCKGLSINTTNSTPHTSTTQVTSC
jgi:hypothetical protein